MVCIYIYIYIFLSYMIIYTRKAFFVEMHCVKTLCSYINMLTDFMKVGNNSINFKTVKLETLYTPSALRHKLRRQLDGI
jgi:hypothetical protein